MKHVIISSCPPHSGSTFLINALYGFITPNKPINRTPNKHTFVNLDIIKMHEYDIQDLYNNYKDPNIELYFISIKRGDSRVKNTNGDGIRFLEFDYYDILETVTYSLSDIVDYFYSKIRPFLPSEFPMNKKTCIARLEGMNSMVEKLKDKPFSYYETFYQIHGSHRNRKN